MYAKWVHDTIVDEKELAKWHHKEKEVSNILRLRKDGKEYIQHSFQNWRLDKDLNPDNRFVPKWGRYPIPHAVFRRQQLDFGRETKVFKEITEIEEGYFIDFSKEKLDEIKSMGIGNKISYAVAADNGIHITVSSYEDLRDTDYDELLHFGRKAAPTEKKIWVEQQGGATADKQKIENFKYNLNLHQAGIPERSPTTAETQKMIAEEIVKATSKSKEDNNNTQPTKRSRKSKKKAEE